MRILKVIIHLVLLTTIPTLLAYPQGPQFSVQTVSSKKLDSCFKKEKRYYQATYDEILHLLEEIESGKAEKIYRSKDLDRIDRYLAFLAKKGASAQNIALLNDIDDLLNDLDTGYILAQDSEEDYSILPAINTNQAEYILCKNWFEKQWKKTKKFVKNHKKEILIGAAIVLAAAIVVVAVVATAPAAAAAAGAAGAAAAAGCNEPESPKQNSPPQDTQTMSDNADAPLLAAAIDEHIVVFKEFMAEDVYIQELSPSEQWDDLSFIEKTRELGAFLAHKAFDEVSELASAVPQLYEELKAISSSILPQNFSPPQNGELSPNALENYERLVTEAHLAIDRAFSSDQAILYTPEAKANDQMNHWAIGMIPLPSGIPKLFANTSNLINAGNAIDRAGFTRVGRGLMKHGYREGSLFPKPLGNPAQINKQGEAFLKEILNDPKRTILKNNRGGIEIYSQSGRGAYFREDGTFRGFIEYGHK